MTDIQKEYCDEKGLVYIKPENTEIADYVSWLESQILALRIPDVVGRSEQLCGKPNCNRQKLDNSPLCSYHLDIANS